VPLAVEKVLVYRAESSVEARALACRLQDEGVDVDVVGEFRETAYPGISLGRSRGVELWIASDDLAAAKPLIGQWHVAHHPPREPDAPGRLRFSVASLLWMMTAAAWVFTALALGASFGLAVSLLLYAWIAVLCVRKAMRPVEKQADDETPSDAASPP
jgi:hypothetical protein